MAGKRTQFRGGQRVRLLRDSERADEKKRRWLIVTTSAAGAAAGDWSSGT